MQLINILRVNYFYELTDFSLEIRILTTTFAIGKVQFPRLGSATGKLLCDFQVYHEDKEICLQFLYPSILMHLFLPSYSP